MKMLELAMRAALTGVAVAALAFPAVAADIQEPPPIIEAPAPQPIYEAPAEVGGWYIRGDVGYHQSDVDAIDYLIAVPVAGPPASATIAEGQLRGDLDDGFGVGVGIGYQVNNNFRVDLTADHWFKSDFKGSSAGSYDDDGDPLTAEIGYTTTDASSVSTWLLLANAYVDLGTWHGITPYVGAGIGGAHVKWDNLSNTNNPPGPPGTIEHNGASSWRFAAAVMAGASYCLTKNMKLDAGYRYSRIQGGKMFDYASGGNNGPGYDGGFDTHEVRAGLRYQFGGGSSDCGPTEVAYEPAPPTIEPIYK